MVHLPFLSQSFRPAPPSGGEAASVTAAAQGETGDAAALADFAALLGLAPAGNANATALTDSGFTSDEIAEDSEIAGTDAALPPGNAIATGKESGEPTGNFLPILLPDIASAPSVPPPAPDKAADQGGSTGFALLPLPPHGKGAPPQSPIPSPIPQPITKPGQETAGTPPQPPFVKAAAHPVRADVAPGAQPVSPAQEPRGAGETVPDPAAGASRDAAAGPETAPQPKPAATALPASIPIAPASGGRQPASPPQAVPLIDGPSALRVESDIGAIVDRIAEARAAAQPAVVRASLDHAEFGQISLRFHGDHRQLAATVASADPAFIPAVQNAAAAALSADAGQSGRDGQPRDQSMAGLLLSHDGRASDGQPQGGPGHDRERGARPSAHEGGTAPHPGKPRADTAASRAARRGDLFA